MASNNFHMVCQLCSIALERSSEQGQEHKAKDVDMDGCSFLPTVAAWIRQPVSYLHMRGGMGIATNGPAIPFGGFLEYMDSAVGWPYLRRTEIENNNSNASKHEVNDNMQFFKSGPM